MTILIPAYLERCLKFALVLALFVQPSTVGATDQITDRATVQATDQVVDQVTGKVISVDEPQPEQAEHSSGLVKKRRKCQNHRTATCKSLSYSFDDFYHRHDTSGCYFLGQALITINADAIDDSIKLAIKDDLAVAKRYCTEDRQSRKLAIDHMRNALRILNGHPGRGLASED